MADVGENFHIDIRTLTARDIIELIKLLPSTARIHKGIGIADTLSAIQQVQIKINSKKNAKVEKLQNDWFKEENEADAKRDQLTALDKARAEYMKRAQARQHTTDLKKTEKN